MIAEALQPLIKELTITEKRRLLEWLKNEVEETPKPKVVDTKLREQLIKHISKARSKNALLP